MVFAEIATTLLTKVVVSYSEVAHPQMGDGLAMNTAQESSFGKALYYPYIQIQDENQLKCALLYFDGINRIVPRGTHLHDSEVVRAVVDEGLLEATSPEDYAEAATEKFEEDILSLLEQETPEAITALKQASQAFSKKRVSTSRLHLKKMTHLLPMRLKALGLAREIGNWLEVDAHIAGSYMMCLASVMSGSIQAPLITDTSEYQSLGEFLSFGQLPQHSSTDPLSILLTIGVDFPDPKSLKDVPIADVLSYHKNRKDERKQFRREVESIRVKANQVSDPIALNDFFQQQKRDIESAITDHQKALSELKIKSVGSFLRISAPTIFSTLAASTMVPQAAPVLAIGGITWGFVEWWAEIRGKQREAIKKCPWHYLLSTKQVYRPKTSFGARLWALRQKAIAMGEPLLTSRELEREIAERRGGYGES